MGGSQHELSRCWCIRGRRVGLSLIFAWPPGGRERVYERLTFHCDGTAAWLGRNDNHDPETWPLRYQRLNTWKHPVAWLREGR